MGVGMCGCVGVYVGVYMGVGVYVHTCYKLWLLYR